MPVNDDQSETEVQHEYEVGELLQKTDSSHWKITNRMVDVDTDEVLYRLREADVGPSNFTEILTDEDVDRLFETADELCTDGGVDQSESATDHDTVQEALNRASYEKRSVYGEVDGEDVLVVADVDSSPKLTVYGGGTYEAYSDPEFDDEYAGGEVVSRTFDRADQLTTAFTALRDKYDLQEVQA